MIEHPVANFFRSRVREKHRDLPNLDHFQIYTPSAAKTRAAPRRQVDLPTSVTR